MRYGNDFKRFLAISGLAALSTAQAFAQGAVYPDSQQVGVFAQPMAVVEPVSAPVAQQNFEPEPMPQPATRASDIAQYDGVGYATIIGAEYAGGPTASGEAFNPNGFSAGHNSLPVNSFAEITHLTTGKTILVRINDKVPNGNSALIALSPAAVALVGGVGGQALPVRIRRVNPPDQEKSALAQGQKGADRMNTPEQLLVALRKKLGSSTPVMSASVEPAPQTSVVATAPAPMPKVTARAAVPKKTWKRPGANYENPPVAAAPVAVEAPAAVAPVQYETAPQIAQDLGQEYIIEDGSRARARASAAAPTGGRYFVQLAAFNDRGRAYALAHRARASVVSNGALYRVRFGPYANEDSARATLGALASKGYLGARVTR